VHEIRMGRLLMVVKGSVRLGGSHRSEISRVAPSSHLRDG